MGWSIVGCEVTRACIPKLFICISCSKIIVFWMVFYSAPKIREVFERLAPAVLEGPNSRQHGVQETTYVRLCELHPSGR